MKTFWRVASLERNPLKTDEIVIVENNESGHDSLESAVDDCLDGCEENSIFDFVVLKVVNRFSREVKVDP